MELEITKQQIPGKISFNYEELKESLTTRVKDYESMVYSENEITYAKKDRADLNRLKKALNDERIRQEKEFMKPFEEFKEQIKELCGIVDKASAVIDSQVKAFEDKKKAEKLEEISAIWAEKEAPDWMIRNDPKWLNASTSIKSIESEISEHLLKVQKDLDTLDSLGIGYEAMQNYQVTLDLNSAITLDAKIKAQAEAKAKWEAEHAQVKIEEIQPKKDDEPSQKRQWIGFQALLTVDEAKALGNYLKSNNIKYKAI